MKNLKYIGVSRGGPVNIDIDACKKKSIIVANAPGRNASAVAEFTVAKILAQTKPGGGRCGVTCWGASQARGRMGRALSRRGDGGNI